MDAKLGEFTELGYLHGMKLVEDVHMTKPIHTKRKKTFKERWFNSPWRPWDGERVVTTMVPSDQFIVMETQRTIVAHPEAIRKLKASLRDDGA